MREQVFRLRKQMMLEGDSGAEGMVLIDGHTGSMCACNSSAGAMLGLLKDGAGQGALVRVLMQMFAISEDRASDDARGFLQSLSAMGAIESVDSLEESLPHRGGHTELQPAW